MRNQSQFQTILDRRERDVESVLTLIAATDQSVQANRNRAYLTRARRLVASVGSHIHDASAVERYKLASPRLTGFLESHRPQGESLVVIVDAVDGFFWSADLSVPVEEGLRWATSPWVRPLLAAEQNWPAYGIVLADRTHARLFTVILGHIEEQEGFTGADDVRHVRTAGFDHAGSASHFERHADEVAKHNLREMSRHIDALIRAKGLSRMVLAGSHENLAALRKELPAQVLGLVVGEVSARTDIPARHILETTMPVIRDDVAFARHKRLEEYLAAKHTSGHVTMGVPSTLAAVNASEVRALLLSDSLKLTGRRCRSCSALFEGLWGPCEACGGETLALDDLVEPIVHRVLSHRGGVEVVEGAAGGSFEGIGSFLKGAAIPL